MNFANIRAHAAAQSRFGYLLAAIVALLVTAPVIGESPALMRVLALFASGVMVAGLYVARPGRRSLIIGSTLAALDVGIGSLLTILGFPAWPPVWRR